MSREHLSGILAERGLLPRSRGIIQKRSKTDAFKVVWNGEAGQIAQGRVDVDEFNKSRRLTACPLDTGEERSSVERVSFSQLLCLHHA